MVRRRHFTRQTAASLIWCLGLLLPITAWGEGRLGSAPRPVGDATTVAQYEAGGFDPLSGAAIGPQVIGSPYMPPGCGTSPCVPAAFPSDYWIVSSRGCPPCDRGWAPQCTSCFRHTVDGRVRRVGFDDVIGGLDPSRPVTIVVHGSYNYDSDVLVESRNMHRWLSRAGGQPAQMIYFTWPSDGYVPVLLQLEIAVLGRRSSYHSAYLAHLISRLPPGQPVTLMGHSHGARVSVAAAHLLGGGRLENGQVFLYSPAPPRRIRAVLLAAAIDHDWLNPGDRYGRSLCVLEQVLVLRNMRDFWLSVYPLRKPFGDQALGRTGLSPCDRGALGPLGAKVVEFDVTRAIGRGHNMAQYYSRPAIGAVVAPFAEFRDSAVSMPSDWVPLTSPGPAPVRTEYRGTQETPVAPTPPTGPTLGPALVPTGSREPGETRPASHRPKLFVAPSRRALQEAPTRAAPATTGPVSRPPGRTNPRPGEPVLEFDDGE
jgi:hypothetical protein